MCTRAYVCVCVCVLVCMPSNVVCVCVSLCSVFPLQSTFIFLERPFFEVDVQLAVPHVRLSPDPTEVQEAMNKCAVAVLSCNKQLWDWGQAAVAVRSHTLTLTHTGSDRLLCFRSLLCVRTSFTLLVVDERVCVCVYRRRTACRSTPGSPPTLRLRG